MSGSVRVGLVGVGNCAAALIHGVNFYRDEGSEPGSSTGLMERSILGYELSSIRVVAAFDVAQDKVGFDLAAALESSSICTRFSRPLAPTGVMVRPGPVLDGLGRRAARAITIAPHANRTTPDILETSRLLREAGVDVLVNFLPVGSTTATAFYARCALAAQCAFINAIPTPIARVKRWRESFRQAGIPLLGDDIKSQVGATIVHRALVELLSARGYDLINTYQFNFGGNADFLNLMSRERLKDKRRSKTGSVTELANRGRGVKDDACHISPSDHVPFLKDTKIAFIRLEGRGFAGAPIELELRMEVEDSPNSAGVVVDAIRYAKVALDAGEGGYLPPSAWLMKAPAVGMPDAQAKAETDAWLGKLAMRLDDTNRPTLKP